MFAIPADKTYFQPEPAAAIQSLVEHLNDIKRGLAKLFVGRTTANKLVARTNAPPATPAIQATPAEMRRVLVTLWLNNCSPCRDHIRTEPVAGNKWSRTRKGLGALRRSQQNLNPAKIQLFQHSFDRNTLQNQCYRVDGTYFNPGKVEVFQRHFGSQTIQTQRHGGVGTHFTMHGETLNPTGSRPFTAQSKEPPMDFSPVNNSTVDPQPGKLSKPIQIQTMDQPPETTQAQYKYSPIQRTDTVYGLTAWQRMVSKIRPPESML